MCPRGVGVTPNYWKKMKVIVIPISFKPSVQNKCGTSRGPHTQALYRVTHHVVQNKKSVLAWIGLAKATLLFLSPQEVLHNVMCHPEESLKLI